MCTDAAIIIADALNKQFGYTDAVQLQRRRADGVTELVLRFSVSLPNRYG
jgi:hypothetical protein